MTSVKFLRRITLFEEFSTEELEEIQYIFQEKEYKKNQVVFYEEETGQFMYIVKYGEIKIVQSYPDGRENILAIHHSGEAFGEMSLLDGKTSPAAVVAMEDCKIIAISKEHFWSVLMKKDKFIHSLMKMLCSKLRQSWNSIQILKFTDAETRLKHVFLELASTDGVDSKEGKIISVKVTHQELAEMVGTSRETVSRIISKLSAKNILRISSHRYVLKDHPYWRT